MKRQGGKATTGPKTSRLSYARWVAEQRKAEKLAAKTGSRKGSGKSARSSTLALRDRISWRWWLIKLGFKASLASAAAIAVLLGFTLLTMPSPKPVLTANAESGVLVIARDGIPISGKSRPARQLPLAQMPQSLIDAVLVTEDRRFYSHWGVDPWGLLRASFTNIWRGRTVQGGSTITQQLAKNLFLEPERTLKRKAEELLYALALEIRYSKDEILELYLNRVYFGGGAYGVAAAADTYFGRQPEQLTLGQSALLAGLLKAPSRYAPTNSVDLARARTGTVLNSMAEAQVIDPAEAKRAASASLELAVGRGLGADAGTGYAADWIAERLPQLVTGATGKLTVETTLDTGLQHEAEMIVERLLASDGARSKVSQAALVVLDLKGGVRALVGGRSYAASPFNRAIKAHRQPGSAFKPFIYLAAIEAGLTPDTVMRDAPFTVGKWTPRNYTGTYQGAVTARQAMAESINTVAVELYQTAGRNAVTEMARRLGIRSDLTDDASLALGTSEVTPIELAGAYLPIANGGLAAEPYLVTRIRDAEGKARFRRAAAPARRLIAAADVAALTDMLTATVTDGTGKAAALFGIRVAGKTGTTQESRDAWFAGFTGDYLAVVWVGNDDGTPMNHVTGGGLPARIWHDVMVVAHGDGAGRTAPKLASAGTPPKSRPSGLGDFLSGLTQPAQE
jgi:penicillin-binding protein 1A